MAAISEGSAYRVTVALGTTDEIFDNCYVEINFDRGVVNIFEYEGEVQGVNLATAPLGRTLVRWVDE
ncbi:MAG TPA: hypothetical protein VF263_18015 [Longimicrobiaceae bacterium]